MKVKLLDNYLTIIMLKYAIINIIAVNEGEFNPVGTPLFTG